MFNGFTFKIKAHINGKEYLNVMDFKIHDESLRLLKIDGYRKQEGYLLEALVYKYDIINSIHFYSTPFSEDCPTYYEMTLFFKDKSKIIFEFFEPDEKCFDEFVAKLLVAFK